MLLYDCVPNLKHFLRTDNRLKNSNALQVGTSQNSASLSYSETTESKKFFDEKKTTKNVKITKQSYVYIGDASTYNVDILNFFNPELQLKDAVSAIKNELIDLLSELRGFEFVTSLVLRK